MFLEKSYIAKFCKSIKITYLIFRCIDNTIENKLKKFINQTLRLRTTSIHNKIDIFPQKINLSDQCFLISALNIRINN